MHSTNAIHDLLIFAHFNEARAFIDHYQLEQTTPGLFAETQTKHQLAVFICSEGVFNAGEMTTALLAKLPQAPKRIINLGVCGSLNPKIKPGDVHFIRTFYLAHVQGMDFHSHSCSLQQQSTIDCVTSMVRANHAHERSQLQAFAPLVDREGHALARVAHRHHIAFAAIKVCSDVVGENQAMTCQDIQAMAMQWSNLLLQSYLTISSSIIDQKSDAINALDNINTGSMTFSQQHKLKSLLLALNLPSIPLDIPLQQWQHLRPKDINREILHWLEERAFPWRGQMREKLQQIAAPLKTCGVHVSFDPEMEREGIHINHYLASPDDAQKLAKALSDIDWQQFHNLFNGQWRD